MTETQETYDVDGVTAAQLEEIRAGVLATVLAKGAGHAATGLVAMQVEILMLRKALEAAGIPAPEHEIGMARAMLGLGVTE